MENDNPLSLNILKNTPVDPQLRALVPAKAANHYRAFPMRLDGDLLTVAMVDPQDLSALDDLSVISRCKIQGIKSAESDILDAIREYYGIGAETIERMMSDGQGATNDMPAELNIDEASSEASISRLLNQILSQAHREKATDIHIEPFANELRIRYRTDGNLYDAKVPANVRFFHEALISRIKILCNLNIAEKRLPQDGRFKVRVNNVDLDLRVSFLPTSFGESCVIRLLNSFGLYSFEQLGISGAEMSKIQGLLTKPHGIVFMTGPTGSGKTTTLYSCLAALNTKDTKIITVEDPVEYQIKGIVQVQTNAGIGLTFAQALRTILRNDPDVIMIGEVRDFETAQIAIQMSLTGHLVFSTLHTNDAASGVTRLLDIGIEPYLIASSVECFIAQRLVRLLCASCKRPVPLDAHVTKQFGLSNDVSGIEVFEPQGCTECRMSGYVGRQAICEILVLNEELRSMIIRREPSSVIHQKAVSLGMKTLRQHGWEKVVLGITSPSEVMRATQVDL